MQLAIIGDSQSAIALTDPPLKVSLISPGMLACSLLVILRLVKMMINLAPDVPPFEGLSNVEENAKSTNDVQSTIASLNRCH